MTSEEKLRRGLVRIVVANIGHEDPEVRGFIELLDDWHWSYGGFSLDRALGGVPNPGQRKALTEARLSRRDGIVVNVAARFFRGDKPTVVARKMSLALGNYAGSAWPRERGLKDLPASRQNTLEGEFWRMLRLEDRALSERHIRRILRPGVRPADQ